MASTIAPIDQALAEALATDDAAEDAGMHADDRRTCWTCQAWADHEHEWMTGRIIRAA